MNRESARESARAGSLYPAVILHGADEATRQELAVELARILLCEKDAKARPCGVCRQCRRIAWPAAAGSPFHPDFRVLGRDLRTSTSAAATRELLRGALVAPYEARGQVFVVADAQSLTPEAADALLKVLEEPYLTAPRHFLLLAASRAELAPTLRSRSLSVFLGPQSSVDVEAARRVGEALATAIEAWAASGSTVWLLAAAAALAEAGGWEDPRAGAPWATAAAGVLEAAERIGGAGPRRRGLLALAQDLLEARALRLRGIPANRVLEGLVARRLGPAS